MSDLVLATITLLSFSFIGFAVIGVVGIVCNVIERYIENEK